jgi:hypothetical protein
MEIIERKIKCRDTLALIRQIVFNAGDESAPDSKNMPIGSLLSQWSANLYQTPDAGQVLRALHG